MSRHYTKVPMNCNGSLKSTLTVGYTYVKLVKVYWYTIVSFLECHRKTNRTHHLV